MSCMMGPAILHHPLSSAQLSHQGLPRGDIGLDQVQAIPADLSSAPSQRKDAGPDDCCDDIGGGGPKVACTLGASRSQVYNITTMIVDSQL